MVQTILILAFVTISAPTIGCPGDLNGDNSVTVDELVTAVGSAMNGCAAQQPTPTRTPVPSDDLSALLGYWRFTFTITDTFTFGYDLDHVEVVNGARSIVGFYEGGGVIVALELSPSDRTATGYQFSLLHPMSEYCSFYLFNHTATNTVRGKLYPTYTEWDGSCGNLIGLSYSMTGTRTVGRGAGGADSPEIQTAREHLMALEIQGQGGGGADVDPALQGVADALRRALRE